MSGLSRVVDQGLVSFLVLEARFKLRLEKLGCLDHDLLLRWPKHDFL